LFLTANQENLVVYFSFFGNDSLAKMIPLENFQNTFAVRLAIVAVQLQENVVGERVPYPIWSMVWKANAKQV